MLMDILESNTPDSTELRAIEGSKDILKMHEALTSIVGEIMRFEQSENYIIIKASIEDENKFNNIVKCNCKAKLKSKKQTIARLRKDVKAACCVAKTMELENTRKTTLMAHQLAYARGECVDLLEKYTNNINIFGNLHKQNETLHDKLNNLENLINLGYQELKKIQAKSNEEPTTLGQLKALVESCGQYYADYCNEYDINLRINQRNRFLKSKIITMECNIEAIKEQLKGLKYRNLRLTKENHRLKAKTCKPNTFLNYRVAYSGLQTKNNKEQNMVDDQGKFYKDSSYSLRDSSKDLKLSTHLAIVKRLLSDQDTLLNELTIISKEISIGEIK